MIFILWPEGSNRALSALLDCLRRLLGPGLTTEITYQRGILTRYSSKNFVLANCEDVSQAVFLSGEARLVLQVESARLTSCPSHYYSRRRSQSLQLLRSHFHA